ncbi:GNAT family N-acetyltransferase [Pelagibius sp.]|uniref:GNAT family N-acetyltransferase n=1 Tax=Pelagibius sp. TaxID=1931238 RepID=UPI002631C3E2|nr:N-acetyltransferase [Pelagibius sp.]
MLIRETSDSDLPVLLDIHRRAFGQDVEAELTRDILNDPSAEPVLSLMALDGEEPLGHVLFSRTRLTEPDRDRSSAILAPLAVVPEAQRQGVGGALVEGGLARLAQSGSGLVFVLGDPGYYGRFGFEAARPFGLATPFPIPEAYAEAWMVRALDDGGLNGPGGRVVCCDALSKPEYWSE